MARPTCPRCRDQIRHGLIMTALGAYLTSTLTAPSHSSRRPSRISTSLTTTSHLASVQYSVVNQPLRLSLLHRRLCGSEQAWEVFDTHKSESPLSASLVRLGLLVSSYTHHHLNFAAHGGSYTLLHGVSSTYHRIRYLVTQHRYYLFPTIFMQASSSRPSMPSRPSLRKCPTISR